MMDNPDKITTGNYLNIIKRIFIRRWWLILLITFVVAVSAFITSKIVEPVYEASTSIRVQSPLQLSGGSRSSSGQISLEPEAMWLKSRYLIEIVMKNLGIGNINNQKEYVEIMEKLQRDINVKTFEGANTLVLTMRWNDPEMVAKITNALADTFIEKYQIFNNALAKDKRAYIEEQLNLIRIKLDEVQKKLSDFQKKEGIISLDEKINEATNRISMWEAKQYQIEMDIKIAQSKLNQLKEQVTQTTGDSSHNMNYQGMFFKENTALSVIQENISKLESEIVSMSYKYTDEYSPLLIKKKKLEEMKDQFKSELVKTAANSKSYDNRQNNDFVLNLIQTEIEIEAKLNEQALLTDLIKKEQEKMKSLPEKQALYVDILREKKVNEEHYTNLLKRLAEARIEENVDMWDVRIFDRAYQPYKPLKPKPVQNTVFGAIIGLVLGIGISMVFEYFDDSFHSISEVEEFLGLPVLAAIPKMED